MNKKKFYQLLASASLLGAVSSQTIFQAQAVYASDFTTQKGTFTVGGSVLNVRSQASTSATIVASYQPGQQINYDQIGTANGYRWISYVGGSGNRNYVAIGTADGSQSFGSLSGEGNSSGGSVTSEEDFSYLAGTWKDANGRQIEIQSNGLILPDNSQIVITPSGGLGIRAEIGGAYVKYFRVGEAIPGLGGNEDLSRERLLIGNGLVISEDVLYRVEENVTKETVKEENTQKTVTAKKFTGSNPYSADLIKNVRVSNRNGDIELTHYALYDVDDNGLPELLLGRENGDKFSVYAVYTMIKGEPEKVIALTDNLVVTVYENGQLMSGGRASADEVGYYVVSLRQDNSGFDRVKDGVAKIGQEYGVDSAKVVDFDWKLISEVEQHLADEKTTSQSSNTQKNDDTTTSQSSTTQANQEEEKTSSPSTTSSTTKESDSKPKKSFKLTNLLPNTGDSTSMFSLFAGIAILIGAGVAVLRKKMNGR